jgi:hypothetical protein
MSLRVSRISLCIALMAPVAFAEEDGAQEAQEAIAEEADTLGEKAGVKSEVLDGGSYGSAGCGLGSLIFTPGEGFMQVFAATTNGSSGTQTFGITSGTSNCDGTAKTTGSIKNFIAANRSALAVDVARGGGETIRSLTALGGCQNEAAVGSTLQRNFSGIFPDASVSDQQVGSSVVRIMAQDSTLACQALG